MKKLFLVVLFLLFSFNVYAAPPSRVSTYTTGTVISSTAVTANEDALFNYLSAGVDTYSDGTIVNADINTSANIQSDKLNLTSIAQDVAITSAGSFTNGGATTLNGAVTLGDAIADTLVIDAGAWTLTNATTFTLTGALTFSGTIADLGTVTTGIFTSADINGGTLDGVQIGGETATGMLLINNATDDADGLGSQGTTGQVLTSAGSGANPTWAGGLSFTGSSEVTNTSVTANITLATDKIYIAHWHMEFGNGVNQPYIRFNDDTGNNYNYAQIGYTYANPPVSGNTGAAGTSSIIMGDTTNASDTVNGYCIINTFSGNGASVYGQSSTYSEVTGNNFYGYYSGGAVTSMEVGATKIDGTDAAVINVYVSEYPQS